VEFVSVSAGLSGYIAELGAAIVGAMTSLAPHHFEDHAAYVSDWLTLLKSDPRAFLSAAAKAQAAVDWLVERAGHPAATAEQTAP
jgi:antirestriction protein ArdC